MGITAPENSTTDRPFFFYMPNASFGELCQWYPSTFTVSKSEIYSLIGQSLDDIHVSDNAENTITFNCAEQLTMFCKAGRFNDRDT